MKDLNVNEKRQYETPTMELLVVTGREVMNSPHDNAYVDMSVWEKYLNLGGYAPKQEYYDE